MKGFGARERNGLITFACIIAILLGIGPVADRLGCTRRASAPPPAVAADTAVADSVSDDSSGNDLASDGHKKSRKKKSKKDKSRRGRKKSGSGKGRKQAPPAERRNYLDEEV